MVQEKDTIKYDSVKNPVGVGDIVLVLNVWESPKVGRIIKDPSPDSIFAKDICVRIQNYGQYDDTESLDCHVFSSEKIYLATELHQIIYQTK